MGPASALRAIATQLGLGADVQARAMHLLRHARLEGADPAREAAALAGAALLLAAEAAGYARSEPDVAAAAGVRLADLQEWRARLEDDAAGRG